LGKSVSTEAVSTGSLADWLLQDLKAPEGAHSRPAHVQTHRWWQVMCLTGVDYFSTLGYQPGIAFLAAGFLSPVATFVLVLVTLFAALPVYSVVAKQSPNGQGSISMLAELFPGWSGKIIVLCLLGFAATDFIITMTLSAADATAHVIENPFFPHWLHHKLGLTLVLLGLLGGIFLIGFREAIGVAVAFVGVYLSLNLIVVGIGLYDILAHPTLVSDWTRHAFQSHGSIFGMVGVALLVFPKLALGLSGFETGVAVMPLVEGDLPQRIKNTRKLLMAAALIMSVFLMGSSIVTSVLIDPHEFEKGGEANGRALAFLAHRFLGDVFGTVYDASTILILAFAGASAMAGLLNLVPRYLPRFGMAPEWARASRPLVLVFVAIAFVVTIIFKADVDAQGGAYATGVLVLMTSASLAVTISAWRSRLRVPFLLITAVFVYTTVLNVVERPEGIKIASFFILLTVGTSLFSRAMRSTELRIHSVTFDDEALQIIDSDPDKIIRVIAHRPRPDADHDEYDKKDESTRSCHHLTPEEHLIFIEIEPGDASDFSGDVEVKGARVGRHLLLRTRSAAVPNALAAILIAISERTGRLAHAYFGWTEGNPIGYLFRFLFLGEGDVAPITREVLRKKFSDPRMRPNIHVS
jgi:hypothetical protein